MRFCTLYCIRTFVGVVMPFLFVGCWEEIEYRDDAPATAAADPAPSPTDVVTGPAESEPDAQATTDQLPPEPAFPANVEPPSVASTDEAPATNELPPTDEPPVAADPSFEPEPPHPTDVASDDGLGDRYRATAPLDSAQPTADEGAAASDHNRVMSADENLAGPPPTDFLPTGEPPQVPEIEPEPVAVAEPRYSAPPSTESTAAQSTVAMQQTEGGEAAPPPLTSRRAAWLLGSRLSLAALAHDRNVAPAETTGWFKEAGDMARMLGTSVTDLPTRPASASASSASREVLTYLLDEGKRGGDDLRKNYGVDHAALFEVALKSNLLLVLNEPGSSAVEHISTSVERAAPLARLPEELWRPLLDTLSSGRPAVEVRAAVRKMHAGVDDYLASGEEL
jgi:hypothetical protein